VATKKQPTPTPEPTPVAVSLKTAQDWNSVLFLIEAGLKAIGCAIQEDGVTTFETGGRLFREIKSQVG